MLRLVSCWLLLLLLPSLAAAVDPPPFSSLGKPGETIYQTAVPLAKPKKSADRIDGGLNHVVFSLWLPEEEACIRGIYLMPFNITGVEQEQSRAMCRHWKFALVGSNFMRVEKAEFGPVLLAGLKDLALQSKHPEVAHAPLIAASMSAGVGMCVTLAEQLPDRFIACGLACLEVGPETDRTARIPMMSIFGERDGKQMEQHEALLPRRRAEFDASWAIAVQWGRRHEWGQSNNLLWPFFDEVIRQRLPADASPLTGPVQLRSCDPSLAWYGAPSTWKGSTAIIGPAAKYSGEKNKACWLPGPQSAHAWQAFVVDKSLLRITSPLPQGDKRPLPVFNPQERLAIKVEAEAAIPNGTISLYDGGNWLVDGELQDRKAVFEIGPLALGIHCLSVRVALTDGSLELSRPVTVLVAPNAN
ncbi:hypothetical protein ETAA8_36890 [Anatilimnocola aggregata]|uniref:Uncharacterized protein n=1 Tax=Anatilimnocola aggregata TaxID=2528021 RepID=A0A517YEE3_9BACT|nr:hypothetical protein [Anatilimnocola aggregata]QDU28586.1 hypothetical protein ETAA8_36890 [Anatilimnocola aggregata]